MLLKKKAVPVARRVQTENSLRDRVRPVPTVFSCLRRWRNDGL